MKKYCVAIALCAFLLGSTADAATVVKHAKPQHKAAKRQAKRAQKKPARKAAARKAAARKAPKSRRAIQPRINKGT